VPAAAGRGEEADELDDPERARLRLLALAWLKADLAAWARVVDKTGPQARRGAQRALRQRQNDPELAAVRDEAALAQLPEAERDAWRTFWADLSALLERLATDG
jgi:hypothetical protein